MQTMTNEPEAMAARQKIAATAAGMLEGSLSFIEGTRRIAALRWPTKLDQFDPDILPFVAADSETDTLPLGKTRELWSPEALKGLEPEFEQKEQWTRESCQEACIRLIERFANELDRSRENLLGIRQILLRDWDPIGIGDIPEAADEYDHYADKVHVMLIDEDASSEAIAAYLDRIAIDHMGFRGTSQGTAACKRAAEALVALRAGFEVR